MKVSELLNEGMFVVKSKDGVEKRFKNADSAEAKAWKDSTSKKSTPKVAAYSDMYWEKKKDASNDRGFVTPWSIINGDTNAYDEIQRIVESQHGSGQTDWTIVREGGMKRDGTSCATAEVRVQFEYGPDDDMGVDEPTSDTQAILVARNPQKPKQIDFIKYI